jgi:hypothetical protein
VSVQASVLFRPCPLQVQVTVLLAVEPSPAVRVTVSVVGELYLVVAEPSEFVVKTLAVSLHVSGDVPVPVNEHCAPLHDALVIVADPPVVGAVTVTCCEVLSVAPPLSVTVRLTV